jgi:hypothetical protein
MDIAPANLCHNRHRILQSLDYQRRILNSTYDLGSGFRRGLMERHRPEGPFLSFWVRKAAHNKWANITLNDN